MPQPENSQEPTQEAISSAAKKLSQRGASKGGKKRAENLTSDERREIAQKAARERWAKNPSFEQANAQEMVAVEIVEDTKDLPTAIYWGTLDLVGITLPCYVLDNGQRVIGRTAVTEMLSGVKGGGGFEKYIGTAALKPFINSEEVIGKLVAFRLPEVQGLGRNVKGLPANLLLDVCDGFIAALNADYNRPSNADYPPLTERQKQMAVKASMFSAAAARVGLDALIDEATGYQEVREKDALALKLKAYLAEEMRKWEKTFPDELWMEFGRLTNWKGSIKKRPKYWGKLVMELIYDYLDPDVSKWLRENAPKPRGGQNYHQWLSDQYGLQRLIQHIWMVIGMARPCRDMSELRQKMAESFGNEPVQLTLSLPRTTTEDKDRSDSDLS